MNKLLETRVTTKLKVWRIAAQRIKELARSAVGEIGVGEKFYISSLRCGVVIGNEILTESRSHWRSLIVSVCETLRDIHVYLCVCCVLLSFVNSIIFISFLFSNVCVVELMRESIIIPIF